MSYHDYRRFLRRRWLLACGFLMFLSCVLGLAVSQAALPYDVLFIAATRTGGNTASSPMPDVANPLAIPPGSHLMLLKAGDTQPTVVRDAGIKGAIVDPRMSYDGAEVLHSLCPNVADRNEQRGFSSAGCDIHIVSLATKATKQLTTTAMLWKPHGSMATWSKVPEKADPPGSVHLGYGIFNMAPMPIPESPGSFLFTSNGQGLDTIKHDGGTHISFQLYRYDAYHDTVDQIWHSPGAVLHPVMLPNGEVALSTQENHMGRDGRPWAVWAMWPDGSHFRPIRSGTESPLFSKHFCTGTPDMSLVCANYYVLNWGFGTLLKSPLYPAQMGLNGPAFGPPAWRMNPAIPMGNTSIRFGYTPAGLHSMTPWTWTADGPAPVIGGVRQGKVSHPSAAPGGDLLLSYSPGPVFRGMTPYPHASLYVLPGGAPTDALTDMVHVLTLPDHNIIMPIAAVPWQSIYGRPQPPLLTPIANDGSRHALLPKGTPFSLVGSSSIQKGEHRAGQGAPNWGGQQPPYGGSDDYSNMDSQGSEAKAFDHADIAKIQFVVQAGVSLLSYNDPYGGGATDTFRNPGGSERWKVLGDVDPYKFDAAGVPIMDPWGGKDTSFLVRLPCNTSWGMALVDTGGRRLVHPGTWKDTACGEVRVDCGGCHNHSTPERKFELSVAGQPGFQPTDLTVNSAGATVEWADVAPLFAAKCTTCHNSTTLAGKLDLATATLVNNIPRNAAVLTANKTGQYGGYAPVYGTSYGAFQLSRFIHTFSAHRSLLSWVVNGARSDGYTNALFVTETTPGDKTTLPAGTHWRTIDIDYRQAVHDAHTSLALSAAEKFIVDHWIDTGAPVDTVRGTTPNTRGWKRDEFLPVISWFDDTPTTVPNCPCPPTGGKLIFGMYDIGSGLDMASLKVTRDGTAVTSVATTDHRWEIAPRVAGRYVIQVKDLAGNRQELQRKVE